MKLKATNEAIRIFILNASNEIRILTLKGQRSRYTSVLQIMIDQMETHDKSVQKKIKYLGEKYAKVGDNGCFLYHGEGDNRTLMYEPASQKLLDEEVQKLLDEVKNIDVEPYYIDEKDIPKNADGSVRISNALVKAFYPFVFSKEVHDKLVFPELKLSKVPA